MAFLKSPYFIVAFAPLFWAGNLVLAKGVHEAISPITLSFFRWILAFAFIAPFTTRQTIREWQAVVSHWKTLAILAFLGVACFNTMLYTAVHTTTAINASLIQTSMPAWIVLFTLLLFKEHITPVQSLGVLLCISGALYIVSRGNVTTFSDLSFVEGDVWMTTAVLLYALYSALLNRRVLLSGWSLLTVVFGMGCLMLVPLFIYDVSMRGLPAFTWQVSGSILYVALFPSILAYLCWNKGIKEIGANKTGLYINLIPVFASILAVLFLDEQIQQFHLYGLGLILSGMIIFNRKAKR